MAGKLPILHGHEVRRMAMAVNPARGLFMRLKSWGMCGHCHKTSEHTERDIRGTILTTWSVGCLCDLSPVYRRKQILKRGLCPGSRSRCGQWKPPYICFSDSPSFAWGASAVFSKEY